MKLITIAAASALLMLGTAAQAQQRPAAGGMYGELGYTQLKSSGGGASLKPAVLRAIIGYDVHPNLAVEGMLGFGVKKDSTSVTVGGLTATGEVDIQNTYGIFLKPKYNVTNELEVFGRLGYTRTKAKVTATAGGLSASTSSTNGDFSYGVGANYNFTPAAYVGADYMQYYNKNGSKVDGVTVSVGYRF